MLKTLVGAIALTVAVPAIAQTAPAPDPHAQHKGMDHGQHHQGDHDCKACCEKMKGKDGKMACKDEKPAAQPAPAKSDPHQGHTGH